MKYWEVEIDGNHLRIEWNESSTFNIQIPVQGQWVDIHCFTNYNIDSDWEAYEHAIEVIKELE